jgi:dihydroxyacetone kinase phosphoprotein-dependent L subunit
VTHEQALDWLRRFGAAVAEHRQELSRLDTAIGDGDHGTNMDRGMKKALEKLEASPGDDIGATLKTAGMALVSSVGGAAGPLYGTLFMQMGTAAAGRSELDLAGWTTALEAGLAGVKMRGKAEVGDKTMVDALVPFSEALSREVLAGAPLSVAWSSAADTATSAAAATADLLPRMGRARPHAEKSLGTPDAGAYSFGLITQAIAAVLADGDAGTTGEGSAAPSTAEQGETK